MKLEVDSKALPQGSIGIRILKVDEQNRLRFTHVVYDRVTWLNPANTEPSECVAILPEAHGLQLWPSNGETANRFEKALKTLEHATTDPNGSLFRLARFMATSWRIPLSRESKRTSITIPEFVRKFEILPGKHNPVVVFLCGEMLEIWPFNLWIPYCRSLGMDWRAEAEKIENDES